MNRKLVPVTGMSCSNCEQTLESTLGRLDSVTRVEADHEDDSVEIVVDDDVEDRDIRETIESAGYDVQA